MLEKISVILPIYNVEKYLKDAIDSVINQTYTNLEIILVDDGSPDNSGKICDEYAEKDRRIRVIHKENGGVSSARNAGINAATGDWLYFMDPDDWVELNMLEEALNKAKETKSDLCIWDFETVSESQRTRYDAIKSDRGFFENNNEIENMILFNCSSGSVCNFITKADIIKGKIYFDEFLAYQEDEVFKLKLYPYIKAYCYLPKVFYHYRMSEGSVCHSINEKQLIAKRKEAYNYSLKVISSGLYNENAQIVVNSKYLEFFTCMIDSILNESISYFEKKKLYYDYINSYEYKNSINNYDDRYYNTKFAKICLKFKRLPFWFIYLFRKGFVAAKKIKRR